MAVDRIYIDYIREDINYDYDYDYGAACETNEFHLWHVALTINN
jgi:hypothetical protein